MPMVRWFVEMMCAGDTMDSCWRAAQRSEMARSWLGLVTVAPLPAAGAIVELCGGKDAQHGLHAVVAEAADLRAEDGVVARALGREVDVLRLAGDGVLLQAHLGDGEAVDDIDGAEGEVDFAAGGEDELRATMSSAPCGSAGSRPTGLPSAAIDELVARAAEGRVGAGIAEVPGELHAGDFDLQGVGSGAGVALAWPRGVGADSEQEEKRGEGEERKVLKRELVDWAMCAAVRRGRR